MKNKILLSVLIVFCLRAWSQTALPKGVEALGGYTGRTSFILKDKNNNLWQGVGGFNLSGGRYSNGLVQYKNNAWKYIYTSGIFTDAIDLDTAVYFSTYNGLYKYANSQFSIDNSVTKISSIESFQHVVMLGTMGNGLYEKTNTGYKNRSIQINGKSYDSIYCLTASGNELWIGTSNGLVLFDGNNFSKFDLPYKYSSDKVIIKNQQIVFSVQKDVDGKVWVLNANNQDSLECLYFFEKGAFTSARDYYQKQCIGKGLLPFMGKKLALNSNGHIIIGMGWGVLELNNDSISSKQILMQQPGFSFYKNTAFYNIAYCDRYGDGSIYADNYSSGFVKIDPAKFSNKDLLYDANLSMNTIDINDIKSAVGNTGINIPWYAYNNPTLNLPVLKTPSIGCASAMFASSVWMGGLEEGSGDLHLAAETYRQIGIDYKPGPIDLVTKSYDSTASSFYNKLWKINRQTIDDFKANRTKPFYVIPKEIMDWPAHGTGNFAKNLAPFVDTDNNGIYEPAKGDYPKIKGDQMLWWVFNDLGTHGETGSLPIAAEIHGSCYAYNVKDLSLTDSNYIVNRTIFFDYKIINRSSTNYTNFYVGLWNDIDLGNYSDDYVGCDTARNTGYGYNGDDYDEGPDGFGKNPPMILCKLLNKKMNSFVYYNNTFDPINGNPAAGPDYYNYMQSQWKNGDNITNGGNGVGGLMKTKFMFAGDLCNNSGWTEKSAGNSPGDRRFLMSTNTASLKKDSVFDVEFAYTLLYDPSIDFRNQGCDKKDNNLDKIQNWYNHNTFPSHPYYGLKTDAIQTSQQSLLIYPNPGHTILNLKTGIENKDINSIEIMDNSGKLVYQANNSETSGPFFTTIDIRSFASGIYLVKVNTNKGVLVSKVVKE